MGDARKGGPLKKKYGCQLRRLGEEVREIIILNIIIFNFINSPFAEANPMRFYLIKKKGGVASLRSVYRHRIFIASRHRIFIRANILPLHPL